MSIRGGWCILLYILFIKLHFGNGDLSLNTDQTNIYYDAIRESSSLCIESCPYQNRTDTEDELFAEEEECLSQCHIDKCALGCNLLLDSLKTSCQAVCNGTGDHLAPATLHCVMGCNDALNRYFSRLKDEIGTPPAPALVADTLTATSLSLEWGGVILFPAGGRLLVQWRYEEDRAAWQFCRNHTWANSSNIVKVEGLQPYTKYRFRVALLLTALHSEPIVSAPSVVISTLAKGIPQSRPSRVIATAVGPSRVLVSWETGRFPNGPILSYVLQIADVNSGGYSAIKDIPAIPGNQHYIWTNLRPNTTYNASVSSINPVGEGPSESAMVTTLPQETVSDNDSYLILTSKDRILYQKSDLLSEHETLFFSNSTGEFADITGSALHVAKSLLFISDSLGYVRFKNLTNRRDAHSTSEIILYPGSVHFKPLDLSIDWLNDQLYISGEVTHKGSKKVFQIARCGLNGQSVTVAVAGLLHKPEQLEVDPYNGYLFWTNVNGLFRLDLADISNGIKYEIRPELILNKKYLSAFALDPIRFRLLVPLHDNNSVISVSLDGREQENVRPNIQKPRFLSVKSLVNVNGLFYWTTADNVWSEDYHELQDQYYHNALMSGTFFKISVLSASAQPTPVPINPPTGAQAISGWDVAQVSWNPPHRLAAQGRGAWKNWQYEILINNEYTNNSKILHTAKISEIVEELEENTEFCIKVAAYTNAGKGPWSSEFRSKTLRKPPVNQETSILWSSDDGLLRSDVTGSQLHTLVPPSQLAGRYITDIAWFEDSLYLVLNTSQVFNYNMTTRSFTRISDLESVGSIAVDWLGRKLYWANPKQHVINRGSLTGTSREKLSMVALVRELIVDPLGGYIYYSTGPAVECARLNGEQKLSYYQGQMFSGQEVMGLTLDVENQSLYWIIKNYEGSILYTANMAHAIPNGQEPTVASVSLSAPQMRGPLCQFGGRLLWLRDDRSAVFMDHAGKYMAIVSGSGLTGLNTIAVRDPTAHQYFNDTSDPINVIPDSVLADSIAVNGSWNQFQIVWSPISNVNYGQVFYQVNVQARGFPDHSEENTIFPFTNYPKQLTPYSSLDITIRAYTYWATSSKVRVNLFSPPAAPSTPKNPRVFLNQGEDKIDADRPLTATFRWEQPEDSNGPLSGFNVVCGFLEDGENHSVCDQNQEHLTTNSTNEYLIENLVRNVTYYFQVQAYTKVGPGPFTPMIYIATDFELPIPKVLVTTNDKIIVADCDVQETETLYEISGNGKILDSTYLQRENLLFVADSLNDLFVINSTGRTQLLSLNSSIQSLSIDWIQRILYWSQLDVSGRGSNIFSLDLNYVEWGKVFPRRILSSTGLINNLQVSPFTRTLFWIETTFDGLHHLLTSNIDGSDVTPFFKEQDSSSEQCNCPRNPLITNATALDLTIGDNPKILWIEKDTTDIMMSDFNGCTCKPVVNSSEAVNIAIDQANIYWSDLESIHSLSATNILSKIDINNIKNIMQLGTQTYYSHKCLIPKQAPLSPSISNRSSKSITLLLPQVERNYGCYNVIPTVRYVVLYQVYSEGLKDCTEDFIRIDTTKHELEIDNLESFTEYMFCIGASNYYDEEKRDIFGVIFGKPVIFETAVGAPSIPRDVYALAISPTKAIINWLPPTILNSPMVEYEVHWSSLINGHGVITHGKEPVINITDISDSRQNIQLSSSLNGLQANQTYTLFIRTFPKSISKFSGTVQHTDSDVVTIKTFAEPENITLEKATARYLTVSWNESYRNIMEYSNAGYENWMPMPLDGENNMYTITNLKPKSQYKFRLKIWFFDESEAESNGIDNEVYIWPTDNRFIFETLGDKPSEPGEPLVKHIGNGVYKVLWEASIDNGASLLGYSLEGLIGGYRADYSRTKRQANYSIPQNDLPYVEDVEENDWQILYNGTDNYWIISDLQTSVMYTFRVRARNIYGWSEYSISSQPFDFTGETKLALRQEKTVIIVAIAIPLLAFVCLVITGTTLCTFRRRAKDKKLIQSVGIALAPRGPDVELATLRELPRRSNFIHNSNVLYSGEGPPTDAEIAMLPHIARDQITLTNFLGSGAFGEVFEGIAKLPEEMKVAVKTLRKGANDQEKMEFLQEARLMGNFKHKHILQLLGVCLDNDPHFIIMELMEGGDLLSYLRNSRSVQVLGYTDLLGMCLDVAIGCRYLEEMHFVHRDLACRNCLVSSIQPSGRIVKIGDFGLARDIYKNDYYRKEGEGLLPVRWMAPESLVDGVFTCQSDVWAFGILCWEVLTLGEQPYPARSNVEVLHYVRTGGRLSRSPSCPEKLHELMLSCWRYNPEERPSFKECVQSLTQLKADGPVCGFSNRAYMLQDENHNTSSEDAVNAEIRQNTLPRSEPTSNVQMHAPNISVAASTEPPRYLELIKDSDSENHVSMTSSDGYEIPRGSFRSIGTPTNQKTRLQNNNSLNISLKVNLSDVDNLNTTDFTVNRTEMGPTSLDSLLPSVNNNSTVQNNISVSE